MAFTMVTLGAGFAAGLPPPATAHDLFAAYVQHSVHLTVGARDVDLTMDLTFFEEWSARERLAMDTDANGRISRWEVEAYVKKLAPRISRQVKLRVAGHELALVPLYEPKGAAAYAYPLLRDGATIAPEASASTFAVLCDSFWLTGCGGEAESAWSRDYAGPGVLSLIDRFAAAPDRILSVYRRAP